MLQQTSTSNALQLSELCRGDSFGPLWLGQQDVNISPES